LVENLESEINVRWTKKDREWAAEEFDIKVDISAYGPTRIVYEQMRERLEIT
jgi:hypothetical protein